MAGGAGITAIKKRIKSVTNTRKITKAMNVVAISKFRKTKMKLDVNNDYCQGLDIAMNRVIRGYSGDSKYIFGNGSKGKVYIVVASDTGLCGGYNVNVINKACELIKGDKENSKVITMGQKGRSIAKRFNIQTLSEYVDIPDIPTPLESNMVIRQCLDLYNKGEVGEVHIVYTKCKSTVNREVVVKQLLPFSTGVKENEKEDLNYVEFDPSENVMFENVTSLYLSSVLLNCLLSAKASEQSTRMEAMDGATRNANDILDKLNMKYNRIRQSVITQEIAEIVGGAEAQR